MDSDEEFDPEMAPGCKVVDGLNFRELLETGSTNFSMDDYVDIGFEESKNQVIEDEKTAANNLADPFVQKYSSTTTTKFHGVDEYGNSVQKHLTDFDGSFEEMSTIMESIYPNGNVKKLIMEPGVGKQIEEGQIVYIHYFVCIEGFDAPLEDSKSIVTRGQRGQPKRFKVGAGMVLPVIDIGVSTMQYREVAKFLATPEFGYGKLGCPPKIPPNCRVMVTIEVIRVEESSKEYNLVDMDRTERQALPFEELYKGAHGLKMFGNDAFKLEDYIEAKKHYKDAMRILQDTLSPKDSENRLKIAMLYTLNINIAQCGIKLESFKSAKGYCENAVALPLPLEKKLKGYYRLAKCQEELGDLQSAKKNIDIAYSIGISAEEVVDLVNKINNRLHKNSETEKEYAKKMFQRMSLG